MAPKSIDRFIMLLIVVIAVNLNLLNVCKADDNDNNNLDQLMEICDPEKHNEQMTREQIELVYEKFLTTLKGEQELYDLVKESSDLFNSNMQNDSDELKSKYIDSHTLRVCVMYSMVKNALNYKNELVE